MQTLIHRLYLWACQRIYHELAWSYDLVSRVVSLGQWAGWQQIACEYLTGRDVLEIGFGTGNLLRRLARSGHSVYGLEASGEMHVVAERNITRDGHFIPRVQSIAQKMPLAPNSFDTIVSTFPSAYILDPDTLAECARVLRNNRDRSGRLVIVGLWVYLQLLALESLPPVFYHKPEAMWREGVIARIEAAGFQVKVVEHVWGVARIGVIVAEVKSRKVADVGVAS